MKQILSILVENQAGVLSRISGLFSRRGYNIESLAVGITEDRSLSRMTIVVDGDSRTAEQVEKQLNKLIDVIKVRRIPSTDLIQRELILLKVHAGQNERPNIVNICEIMGAKIADITTSTMTLELSDTPERVELMVELLRPFSIQEMVRTGMVALQTGGDTISGAKKQG
ncbi:MAG: acetolactate synthase small subunit [Provencibacterium sp.]|jgi:acetolactate synthase-1/3 small subunit|nr:acetolactate synthase small subunit [Provencibacterium sp.]